ncbi:MULTISPECIES: peptidoglycan-binding protein [unclassified Crossiella]|uniref:peptidoglycan-binding domain-containing protein n=1 Tax=unclassified Crossiella TaxID=2620835 RepID=UPI001FFED574|nr:MULTISPECIES: peptidoglycan-binding domain-containing protein [unclassified Crossiella]MCK2239405.1 peptidoglycan-binding protein [Crossiella sp. S99.2]MCK2252100.1 peptidoglycan-binding protein [Crossiella sp. S99.1]
MAYRLARCLAVLRDEVNARWPGRDKASDGWIGDPAHASRKSDHNPWVKDSNGVGVVRAYDFDSGHGGDTGIGLHIAEHVRTLGQRGHPALGNGSYVISARRIASPASGWSWRTYTGTNPHVNHTHISVSLTQSGYDATQGWGLSGGGPGPGPGTNPGGRPTIRRGSTGPAVAEVQRILNAWYPKLARLATDGVFGPATHARVVYMQQRAGLGADGIVGPLTWRKLLGG